MLPLPVALHGVLGRPLIALRESNATVEVAAGGLSTAVTITFHGGGRPFSWGLTRSEAISLAAELVEFAEAEVSS